jgi:hypothetical protein
MILESAIFLRRLMFGAPNTPRLLDARRWQRDTRDSAPRAPLRGLGAAADATRKAAARGRQRSTTPKSG